MAKDEVYKALLRFKGPVQKKVLARYLNEKMHYEIMDATVYQSLARLMEEGRVVHYDDGTYEAVRKKVQRNVAMINPDGSIARRL